MAIRVLDVKPEENKYLHRDFHRSTDTALRYVGEKFGDNGVKEYLRKFARAYYVPLVADVKKRGLQALEEQILGIYETEEMPDAVKTRRTEERLEVTVSRCPAVTYMKSQGQEPSRWYVELTRTVNETIADLCGLGFTLDSYDEETGTARYCYFRRAF